MSTAERAFYTLDRELRLVMASPNTLILWGKPAKEIIGRRLTDVFPYVEGGDVHLALAQALRSFQPVRLRTHSVVLGKAVEVEIYPVREGLQVSFWPSANL